MERLGENLRTLRKRWKMNQEEMGRRLGVVRSHYSKWEKGTVRFPLEAAFELSKSTGISINDFLRKRLEEKDFPALPIEEGGKAVARGADNASVPDAGDYDLRNIVATVSELKAGAKSDREEIRKLRQAVAGMGDEVRQKMELFEAINVVIRYLEEGMEESVYREEKEKYLSALAAHLSADREK